MGLPATPLLMAGSLPASSSLQTRLPTHVQLQCVTQPEELPSQPPPHPTASWTARDPEVQGQKLLAYTSSDYQDPKPFLPSLLLLSQGLSTLG